MEEIKVGEYIRTVDGIRKIVKINTGNDITIFGTYILDKKYKNKEEKIRELRLNAKAYNLILINYEGLNSLKEVLSEISNDLGALRGFL